MVQRQARFVATWIPRIVQHFQRHADGDIMDAHPPWQDATALDRHAASGAKRVANRRQTTLAPWTANRLDLPRGHVAAPRQSQLAPQWTFDEAQHKDGEQGDQTFAD